MRSGVLHAPLMDLPATTPAGTVAGPRARRSRLAPTPLTQPYVVVAGAPRAGKSSVVNALIGAPGCAPVDAAATASWLVFRHGERAGARAFVPGHREARPIALDGLRSGDTAAAGRGGQSRPPRRIEVTYPADLLTDVALVDTPGVGDLDAATAEIVLDATERAAGLVFVVDAGEPLRRAQLEFLAAAGPQRVVFVLTKIDQHDDWREVQKANQAVLPDELAEAPWFALAGPTGARVDELRQLLAGWAGETPLAPPPPLGGITAATVSSGENSWHALLEREIRNRRVALSQRVSIELATIHVRCVQELGSGRGCPELPYLLDRSLHALSVGVSRQLEIDTAAVIERVFTALLDQPPCPSVLSRINGTARRTVDTLRGDDQERDRALLLTTTSAVATLTGSAGVDSLSAVGLPEPADRVLSAVSVGLTTSCYLMWQPKASDGAGGKGSQKTECRRWLQRSLRVVEGELEREVAQRYDDLQQALAIIAADAVDHGVLLA